MPASIPWWGWLLVVMVCWFVQLIMSIRTDNGSTGAWIIRIAFVAGVVLSTLIGVIHFVKWVWHG